MSNEPNTIKIDDVEHIRKDSARQNQYKDYVLVRTYSAGVHFGHLAERNGKEVVLKNTRRIWYWKGAASLSQMALDGVSCPNDCKFSVAIPENTLTEAIEIMPCTQKAVESIQGVPEWKK